MTMLFPLVCWCHLPSHFSLCKQGRPGASYANDGMGQNNADWFVFHALEGCLPLVYLRCVPSLSLFHEAQVIDFVQHHVPHESEADEGSE